MESDERRQGIEHRRRMAADRGSAVSVAYVDDSEDDLFLAAEALQATGRRHDLRLVGSAVEMWALLDDRIDLRDRMPDVVVIDLKMPKVDGHQLLAALERDEQFARVKKVVLTTSNDHRDRTQVAATGPATYFVKPSRFGELVDVFHEILDLADPAQ